MVNTPHSLAIAPDKDVPDTVRRLETEARFLRETLDKIDETLASVTSNAEVADLRKERETAAGRLGTTAAANVGRELEIAADADREVEQALLPRRN